MKKKIIIIICAALLLGLVGFRVYEWQIANNAVVLAVVNNVKVEKATKMDLSLTSPLTGRLTPVEEVAIVPKAPGQVNFVGVKLGEKIEKGTVLFKLDAEQMQASYSQAKAGYDQANVGYNNAKSNYDRMSALIVEGAISEQQLEQAKYQLDSADASLTQARAGVNMAGLGINNTVVKAPISGYVTSVNIVVGGMASQASAAVTMANIDSVEINTTISEKLINKVNVGDKVIVNVHAIEGKSFDGTITAFAPAPAVGTLTYPLKVSIDNLDAQIKAGMFAEVIISSEKITNVVAVPSDAVVIKEGKTMVAIAKGNIAVFNEVETGLDNGNYIEIKSGVKEGDLIIIEGQYYLEDDVKINIISGISSNNFNNVRLLGRQAA